MPDRHGTLVPGWGDNLNLREPVRLEHRNREFEGGPPVGVIVVSPDVETLVALHHQDWRHLGQIADETTISCSLR